MDDFQRRRPPRPPAQAEDVRDAAGKPRSTDERLLALQRASGNQAVTRLLQRMPVRHLAAARDTVRSALVAKGYNAQWRALVDGIGSQTIRDDVGVDNLARILVQQNNDVARVIRVINNASQADLQLLAGNPGTGALFRELGNLVPPTEQQIERAYTTFLANGGNAVHLGLGGAYAAGMFDAFRGQMLANGGQYWDQAAGAFQRMTEAYRAHSAVAATDGATFSNQIFTGQQVTLATGLRAPVANWQFNPAVATRLELALFLVGVPGGLQRNFTAPMRRAIAEIAAHPQAANRILAGANVQANLITLLDELAGSPNPGQITQVLGAVLAVPPGGNEFRNAINHLDELAPAAPEILRLQAGQLHNLPFGNRAGGLRGHFLKHPLGNQAPAFAAQALWESQQWMTRLGLAPNGLITRGNLPGLAAGSQDEWRIFGQAHWFNTYRTIYYRYTTAASQPSSAAERDALIAYVQANLPDATSVSVAHEAVYENDVSVAFDGAAPNRYLYYDAGNLKVSAYNGPLFMVAAWNGATFDLSTGFMPQGGPAAQYAADLNMRISPI